MKDQKESAFDMDVCAHIKNLEDEIKTLKNQRDALIKDAIGTEKAMKEAYSLLDSALKTKSNREIENQENSL